MRRWNWNRRLGTRIVQLEYSLRSLRSRLSGIRKSLARVNNKLTNIPALQNNYVKRVIATHKKQRRWLLKNFNGLKFSLTSLQELSSMKNLFKALKHCKVYKFNKDGRYMVYLTRTEVSNLKSFLKRDNRKRSAMKMRPGKQIPYLTLNEYQKFRVWLKTNRTNTGTRRIPGKVVPHLTPQQYQKLQWLLK